MAAAMSSSSVDAAGAESPLKLLPFPAQGFGGACAQVPLRQTRKCSSNCQVKYYVLFLWRHHFSEDAGPMPAKQRAGGGQLSAIRKQPM